MLIGKDVIAQAQSGKHPLRLDVCMKCSWI